MQNAKGGGEVRQPRRAPSTPFEFKVDEWAAGIQCVQNGTMDSFFIHMTEDEGVLVDPDNADIALFAVTSQAADMGIQLTRMHGLGERPPIRNQPLDMDTILANPPESTSREIPGDE